MMLLLLSCPVVLLAWSPRLLEMSHSAGMQRCCHCSVVPLALLAGVVHASVEQKLLKSNKFFICQEFLSISPVPSLSFQLYI
jgi:hypothetical protein